MIATARDCAGVEQQTGDEIVCRCLNVRRSTIESAVAVCGLASIREVKSTTGAGDGCTACHARIREMLRNSAANCVAPVESAAGA
ncbi:MAG: (2Fe-2S)-binding protein [Planctomycetaceae bacterium]